MAEPTTLTPGQEVRWNPSFGFAPEFPVPVEVVRIEVAGRPASAVEWTRVQAWDGDVVVDLANGSWAYGDQLRPAKEGERA
jgi:hypothetical protein